MWGSAKHNHLLKPSTLIGKAATTLFDMAESKTARALHILTVDDDPLSSAFLVHLVSLLGHQGHAINDPALAVDAALSDHYDVMLLDLGMPKLNGFDVLAKLREREAQLNRNALPVIAVTGYASDIDRIRCLANGFNDHLCKPIQAKDMSAALARLSIQVPAHASVGTSDAERLRETVLRLTQMKPSDRAFAPTITESFALRAAQLIESAQHAHQHNDRSQARKAIAALRSSADFLGAKQLAHMCNHYEALSAEAQWDKLTTLLAAIDDEHQAVLTVLFESKHSP